ncbi:MAG: shikimate dehydrogenase [Clostridia bacterium]|nr:shikimate dehydrogenase [Clostridia bacterium]
MEYGCIGEKLSHSFSKEIHGALTDYIYELCELSPEALGIFLQAREFKAINVTIPYKQTVIPYLDVISDKAKEIGAVNTVVNRDGKLYGYNTDFYGMKALLAKEGISLAGKKVLILGTGGTSRTALAVAKDADAAEVYRVSRREGEDNITYEQALLLHRDAQVIINTTPVGMFPHTEGCPIDIDAFEKLEAVADAVYNPLCSNLVLSARQKGLPAAGGLYMLVLQAVKAVELFLGQAPEQDKVAQVYEILLHQKQNIVLIGMPACGKSTVGKLLADKLGREFIDTDELVVQKAGESISNIFTRMGESRFRDIEGEMIASLSSCQSKVISTGGGAILRPENLRALRQNGVLFFLDRPLDKLCATDDRPLSSTREALQVRYNERYPRYLSAADKVIAVPEGALQTAEMILKEWEI